MDPSVTAYADLAGEAFSTKRVVATTFTGEYDVQTANVDITNIMLTYKLSQTFNSSIT